MERCQTPPNPPPFLPKSSSYSSPDLVDAKAHPILSVACPSLRKQKQRLAEGNTGKEPNMLVTKRSCPADIFIDVVTIFTIMILCFLSDMELLLEFLFACVGLASNLRNILNYIEP
jgi:hypothetical protein